MPKQSDKKPLKSDKNTSDNPDKVKPSGSSPKTSQPAPTTSSFISNPFAVVIRGFSNVFERNPNPTLILLAVSIGLGIFINVVHGGDSLGTNVVPGLNATLLLSSSFIVIVAWLVNLVVTAMAWLDGIQSAKGKSHDLNEFFRHAMRHFWELVGFYIIYGLLVAVGLLFFIVPGIIFMYWYYLTPLVILDQNKGIFDSMEESKRLIKGLFWEWLGVAIVSIIFSIGGLLSVPSQGGGIGLFYQQTKELRANNHQKPPTHWSNYVLVVGIIFLALLILAIIGLVLVAHHVLKS